MNGALVVSLHDVCPATWPACRTILARLAAEGVRRASLLVIPAAPGGAIDEVDGFAAWLRDLAGAGHEIVQHGLHHARPATASEPVGLPRLLDRVLARGAGEFVAVERDEAVAKLREGRRRVTACGLAAAGFVAPAWLYSPGAAAALAALGFRYFTTHLRVRDLTRRRDHWSFGISNRPGPLAPDLVGRGVNELFRLAHTGCPLLRLAVHPADLDHGRPFEHTVRLLRVARGEGRRAMTYADWLGP